jgi:hypothetical protein
MAPAPEGRRGGFSLTKPGPKEYLIVGGVVLAAALVYMWWKKRQAASTAADTSGDTTDTGTTAPATPTGLSTAALLAWIQDHAGNGSSTTTTSTSSNGGGTTTTKTQPGTVPNVVGQRGEVARDAIEGAGYRAIQVPATTAKGKSTVVTSQNPAGGRPAAKGSTVAISVKVR